VKKSASQSAFSTPRALIALLLCATTVCSILSVPLLAYFRPDMPAKISHRALTFAERVAYQRAIEEVYWRHRIWPKERPDPKPSLDQVIPSAEFQKKVEDYLRNSQALEDYWQQPLTAEQLQSEMERMAQHTKQPEVLRELFEALGNDPLVIAECLARPALAERLVTHFYVYDQRIHGELRQRAEADRRMPKILVGRNASYTVPRISGGPNGCTDDTWTATSTTDAPFPRYYHTAVWTGSEMIVWGGLSPCCTENTGGRYNPATDSWAATSTTNAPAERCLHAAVWTGSEMIVWGGGSVLFGGYLNTGGRYDPTTDSWTATSTTNAPLARYYHTAVWTGTEMIVWGGYNFNQLNTGGRYNPSMDSWAATSTTNAPSARQSHTAVWTGGEMIIWGGYLFGGSSHYFNTGGRYNPTTNSWTGTSTTNAPSGRVYHTAVWTGNEMVVWGGNEGNNHVNTGGRYNPGSDNWIATSTNDAPTPRYYHTAIWTDSEMIVWGGESGFGGGSYLNTGERYWTQTDAPTGQTPTPTPTPIPTPPPPGTGGRYDPSSDNWRATSTSNAPGIREIHTAVWTGSEMIVWGGSDPNGFQNTGGRYCAQSGPTPTPTATPTATPTPSAITLSAHGRRIQGRHTVDLSWSGANAANIDIYRDGVVIATVPNAGSYKDFIGVRGGNVRYTYKVCEAGTQTCSNQVTVRFGGPPL
jgi:N-acetylneuraminic acid mutarotase